METTSPRINLHLLLAMARNTAITPILSTGALGPLVFLSCLSFTHCAGTDSLSCDLTVKSAPKPGEPWCEGSCSLNGKTLFQFGNENLDTALDNLTKEKNATEACRGLPESVKDNLELMRDQLHNKEPERFKTMGNNTLQVTMKCQYNQGQLTEASCEVTIDGQLSFRFNAAKNAWRGSGPDASNTMRQWERNGEVRRSLRKLLMGDFSKCYKELREMPRSTIKSQDMTQPASATQIPPTGNSTQPRSQEWRVGILVTAIIFVCLWLLWLCI